MGNRNSTSPFDFVWDAIPLFELLEEARENADNCYPELEEKIRACATQVVRRGICHCCREEETVVSALTDEFIRQLKISATEGCKQDTFTFERTTKHGNCSCSSKQENFRHVVRLRR